MQFPSFLTVALAAAVVAHAQTPVDPYKKGEEPPPGAAGGGAGVGVGGAQEEAPITLSIREETFSLPIGEASELLRETASDAATYGKVVAMVKSGKARIERLLLLRTKSGQRSVTESIDEFRFPTEYGFQERPRTGADGKVLPQAAQNPHPATTAQPFATSFDTRNVGDTLEIEPVLGPDGVTIDVNLVPQSVRFAGYHQAGVDDGQQQPLFETQKITTSVTVHAGEPYLLGTFNPPFYTNLAIEKKEQRAWLDFLTVDLVSRQRSEGKSKIVERAKAIVLPKMDLREASLVEALDFLRTKSRELDPTKQGFNIVTKVPPSFAQTQLTLSLTNISLLEALKYIANLANLELTTDENALVIHPKGERF